MKKKFILFLFTVTFLFCLTSCGGKKETTAQTESETQAEETKKAETIEDITYCDRSTATDFQVQKAVAGNKQPHKNTDCKAKYIIYNGSQYSCCVG